MQKNAIGYKSAANQFYNTQPQFFKSNNDLAAAILIFARLTATKQQQIVSLKLPDRKLLFIPFTNLPHATEPAHQPFHRA